MSKIQQLIELKSKFVSEKGVEPKTLRMTHNDFAKYANELHKKYNGVPPQSEFAYFDCAEIETSIFVFKTKFQ